MPNTAQVVVGVVDGGIAINLSWYRLEGDAHWEFRDIVLRTAGFSTPRLVNLAKNKRTGDEGWKVDWNAWRIGKDECELHGVNPRHAVERLRAWFAGPEPEAVFSISFQVPS